MRLISGRVERHLDRVLEEASETIYMQTLLLKQAAERIDELEHILVSSYRATRDMAVGVKLAVEEDIDISEDMEALICELSDQISMLEEHHVI